MAGWWCYDVGRSVLEQRASGEEICFRSQLQDYQHAGRWPWFRFDYRHEDRSYPLLVEQRSVAYPLRGLPMRKRIVWRVDHRRSAALWRKEQGAGAAYPPWGLWRRVDDAAIDAFCCWPETDILGPAVDEVALNGGWINGSWRDALYRRQINGYVLHALQRGDPIASVDPAAHWLPPLAAAPATWHFTIEDVPNLFSWKELGEKREVRSPIMKSDDGGRCIRVFGLQDRFRISEQVLYDEAGFCTSFEFQPPDEFYREGTRQAIERERQSPGGWTRRVNSIRRLVSADAFGVMLRKPLSLAYYPDDAACDLKACFAPFEAGVQHFYESSQKVGNRIFPGGPDVTHRYRLWKRLEDCFYHALPFAPGFDEGASQRNLRLGEYATCCIFDAQGGIVGGRTAPLFQPVRQIRLALAVPHARGELDWAELFG